MVFPPEFTIYFDIEIVPKFAIQIVDGMANHDAVPPPQKRDSPPSDTSVVARDPVVVDRETDRIPNGDSSPKHQQRLALNETKPLDGFKRLYSDSEEVINKQLTKIITNDVNFQNLQSQMQNDLHSQLLSDPDNTLIDQLTANDAEGGDNAVNGTRPETEQMQKFFNLLSNDQQQLLKSKLPLLSDITTLDKRNEILIKKLTLCATTFDFLTTVHLLCSPPYDFEWEFI